MQYTRFQQYYSDKRNAPFVRQIPSLGIFYDSFVEAEESVAGLAAHLNSKTIELQTWKVRMFQFVHHTRFTGNVIEVERPSIARLIIRYRYFGYGEQFNRKIALQDCSLEPNCHAFFVTREESTKFLQKLLNKKCYLRELYLETGAHLKPHPPPKIISYQKTLEQEAYLYDFVGGLQSKKIKTFTGLNLGLLLRFFKLTASDEGQILKNFPAVTQLTFDFTIEKNETFISISEIIMLCNILERQKVKKIVFVDRVDESIYENDIINSSNYKSLLSLIARFKGMEIDVGMIITKAYFPLNRFIKSHPRILNFSCLQDDNKDSTSNSLWLGMHDEDLDDLVELTMNPLAPIGNIRESVAKKIRICKKLETMCFNFRGLKNDKDNIDAAMWLLYAIHPPNLKRLNLNSYLSFDSNFTTALGIKYRNIEAFNFGYDKVYTPGARYNSFTAFANLKVLFTQCRGLENYDLPQTLRVVRLFCRLKSTKEKEEEHASIKSTCLCQKSTMEGFIYKVNIHIDDYKIGRVLFKDIKDFEMYLDALRYFNLKM
uniref:F-box domain-containing protein n=1 Tax=Rhabditophanes sp. KR3021 TaxID=114890 RepID=A0AC35TH35_9BILA